MMDFLVCGVGKIGLIAAGCRSHERVAVGVSDFCQLDGGWFEPGINQSVAGTSLTGSVPS